MSDLSALMVNSGRPLVLELTWGFALAQPLVCRVNKNIPFSFSFLCAKVSEFSFSSPDSLTWLENCNHPGPVKTTVTLWCWADQIHLNFGLRVVQHSDSFLNQCLILQ